MRLAGRLIAIIGPNEAGKSSVLNALLRLNDDGPLPQSDWTRRGALEDPSAPKIEAGFGLEAGDIADLRQRGVRIPKKFRMKLIKGSDGPRQLVCDPPLFRPKEIRQALRDQLLVLGRRLHDQPEIPLNESDVGRLFSVAADIDCDDPDLAPEALATVAEIRAAIAAGVPGEVDVLAKIDALLQSEQGASPASIVDELLRPRIPVFAIFDEAARTLLPEYDLNELANVSGGTAMHNLAALARLDIGRLQHLVATDQSGEASYLLNEANASLAEAMSRAWRQSELSVRIDRDHTRLRVHVTVPQRQRYSLLSERSDGLRIFVALLAFPLLRAGKPGVLLIDEAEAHLHYDAQADLLKVFERQTIASAVVYSTHSVGCLPTELSDGVRVVEAIGPDRSRFRNSTEEGAAVGLSALLVAMGASGLGISSMRSAVFTEGPSDPILYPTLIGEVCGESPWFRFVSGVSSVKPSHVPALLEEGVRVAFLVDRDRGGEDHARKLTEAGVRQELIVRLPEVVACIEDLVDSGFLADAVNEELLIWYPGLEDRLRGTDLPAADRWEAIRHWCDTQEVEAPSKVAVARNLVRLAGTSPIVTNDAARGALREVYRELQVALGRSREGVGTVGVPSVPRPAAT